jgi:predicted TIM-barrel fold metal-dependent hydrolase
LRIDAHHSFSERYPLEHLDTILKRNRFDASIAVVDRPIARWHILRDASAEPNDWCVGGWASARARLQPRLPVDVDDLHLAIELAQSYPDLRIAIDHLDAHASPRDLERAAAHPNICCKLSGITSVAFRPVVQHALAVFGPARLMFGSDWPNHLPGFSWKATLAAFTQSIGAQPIEVREQLLGGTAQRFYRLPTTLGEWR